MIEPSSLNKIPNPDVEWKNSNIRISWDMRNKWFHIQTFHIPKDHVEEFKHLEYAGKHTYMVFIGYNGMS